ELSLNPVAVLLAIERRAAQIAQLSAKLGRGRKAADLLEAERVFWRDRKDLGAQLERWRGPRLERLVLRLAALHRSLLANSQAAELLLAQELAQIARQAAAGRR